MPYTPTQYDPNAPYQQRRNQLQNAQQGASGSVENAAVQSVGRSGGTQPGGRGNPFADMLNHVPAFNGARRSTPFTNEPDPYRPPPLTNEPDPRTLPPFTFDPGPQFPPPHVQPNPPAYGPPPQYPSKPPMFWPGGATGFGNAGLGLIAPHMPQPPLSGGAMPGTGIYQQPPYSAPLPESMDNNFGSRGWQQSTWRPDMTGNPFNTPDGKYWRKILGGYEEIG